jgi:hypothetical protein
VKDFFRTQGSGTEKDGLKDKGLVGFHAEISSLTVITAKTGIFDDMEIVLTPTHGADFKDPGSVPEFTPGLSCSHGRLTPLRAI